MRKIFAIALCFFMLISNICVLYAETGSYIVESRSANTDIDDLNFTGLDDIELNAYLKSTIYEDLIKEFGSEEYFIENVNAVYVSKEYIEELEYNSQNNIFFGYTIAELENQYQGDRFVFTLGENDETVVKKLEYVEDHTFEKVLKNLAIGSGVILICVTVTIVSAGAGSSASAINTIFAVGAKRAKRLALSSGAISGTVAAIVKGYQTHSVEESLKAGALIGSDAFKWGAITGSIEGIAEETLLLHGATLNGLTMNQAALIQQESGYPLDVIKQFKSIDEYKIYKKAGLKTLLVNNKLALVRDINTDFYTIENGKKMTNLDRMRRGLAPLDPSSGQPYQLHHINQDSNGSLAILTTSEHQGNSAILNTWGKESGINRTEFAKIRAEFWKALARILG